jgi:recombination protein RecR
MRNSLKKFDKLVKKLEALPSVGKKSAIRIAYHLSFTDKFDGVNLAHAIEESVQYIQKCQKCNGISENEICEICIDEHRNKETLCIVETPKDILIIEESNTYNGGYFVLENIKEESLNALLDVSMKVKEIIFAFPPSMNSESVIIYVQDKLEFLGIKFYKIAHGVPTGVKLENLDLPSISEAIKNKNIID